MDNLVSVIIPVYNVEAFLDRCILSVLGQSYKQLEIILVDDGSTDNSGNICNEYIKKDSRIKLLRKVNGGLSSARNAGMEAMSGKYFTFIDSDDWIESDYIKKLVENIDGNDIDIVQCGYCKRNDKKESIYDAHIFGEILVSKTDILDSFFKTQNLQTMAWMKLYRTDLFQNIRFMEGRNNEDTIFFADYIDKVRSIKIIGDKLYNYYVNPNSIMHGSPSKKKIDDAYFSAEYMLNKCCTNYPEYSLYMMRNICNISTGLYMQLKEPSKDPQLKKYILAEFDKYYARLKGNRDILNREMRLKFSLFNRTKWVYRILWSLKK